VSIPLKLRPRPAGHDDRRNPPAGAEVALHFGPHRLGPLHYVFENTVDDVLLENSKIAVALQIFLQRFQLETVFVGSVGDGDAAEVGKSGFRADRGEFGIVDDDFVAGKLIRPGLNRGKIVVEPGFRMIGRVTWGLLSHPHIVTRAEENARCS